MSQCPNCDAPLTAEPDGNGWRFCSACATFTGDDDAPQRPPGRGAVSYAPGTGTFRTGEYWPHRAAADQG